MILASFSLIIGNLVRYTKKPLVVWRTNEIFLFVTVGFLILVFYLWGTPYKRGFFCDDESLKHPYKDSTVTNVMLYIVGLGLPVLTVSVSFISTVCIFLFDINFRGLHFTTKPINVKYIYVVMCTEISTLSHRTRSPKWECYFSIYHSLSIQP